MEVTSIRAVSECFVRPNKIVEESKKPFHLGATELIQISMCHLQAGLIFNKLPSKEEGGMDSFLEKLKQSLSSTLVHFYPLAGQFVTEIDKEKHNSIIFVDCNKGPGAKFIHAALDDVTVNDIILPTHVPTTIVQSCFQLGKIPTNYDDHDEPMLVVQVTELAGGIFIGISVDHCIVNGTTYWNFFSSWSEIFHSNSTVISRPPNYERWCPEGYDPIIKIPHTHPDEFITRYKEGNDHPIKEVILHFSSESIAKLKAKANAECGEATQISLFQAVSALILRSIIRSRGTQSDESTKCIIVANIRPRVKPALPQTYFGSFSQPFFLSIKVGDLLNNNLGWVASLLHQSVQGFTHQRVHDFTSQWMKSPYFPQACALDPPIVLSGSHREDAYGIEFGLGKAVAVHSGSNKYDGKVVFSPARDDDKGACVELEVYLSPDTMAAFQQDKELVSFLH